MAKRGPKSAAEKNVTLIDCRRPSRPRPPADLSPVQMDIWNAVVATEPAGFFSSDATLALLGDYCRHREASENVSRTINQFKPEWLRSDEGAKRYDMLLRMREREVKAVMRCATKLRMTNQARYTPQAAATASRNQNRALKPWEAEGL